MIRLSCVGLAALLLFGSPAYAAPTSYNVGVCDPGSQVAHCVRPNADGSINVDSTPAPGTTQDTNLKQVNGSTVNVGTGAAGTGTQRVTTSTDSTIATVGAVTAITNALPAGSAIIGKVSVDQTTPGTTNGVQVNAALPAGSNVIGHVINDASSAVIGHVITDATSTTAVTAAGGSIASGAVASGAVASGAYASGALAAGAISDGADVTLGAKADAKSTATDTTPITAMSVLKEISAMEQVPASRAVTNAGTFATQSAITAASGSVASGAIASGAVASGAYAAGSISDGAQVTLGAKADAKSAATDTTAVSAMSVLKEISSLEQAPAAQQSGDFKKQVASTLTRINNSTAYAGTATSPVAVCLFTSVTICAPQTLTVSSTATVHGTITGLRLIKSTTGATGATFRVYAYQAAPTLTSVFDTTVYTPKVADLTSNAYVGSWECGAQIVNGDNSVYNCTAGTNDGHQAFQLTDGTLRFVVVTTGAYAPGVSETFYEQVDTATTVP